ncbi:MAG: PspC domain-containing protein [Ruthenibacterium sp.]|mgnify:FL=1|jgi:phage shock protein C
MAGKRLYKARGQRMVCGVCGGLAEYFGIDPTLVRLAFLLLAAGWGSGLLAYIVAAIIIPEPPADPYR